MKYFRVTFVPNGRQDKEWMVWKASSKDELKKLFNGGSLIDIEEISERFDTLVCLEAIEHFEDKSLIPRLAKRCFVDNIIISFPNKKSTHFNPYHVYDYNSQMVVDLLPDYVCYKSFLLFII